MRNNLAKLGDNYLWPRTLGDVAPEFNRVFDHFFGNSPVSRFQPGWSAPASLWEDEGHFYLEMDLPGVKQEDLEVTLEKGELRIAAERKAPEGDRKYWHQERAYGRVQRMITLPESIHADSIDATLRDGVLSVTLAKAPEAQPKRIEVKAN